jgi:hypothetical protein
MIFKIYFESNDWWAYYYSVIARAMGYTLSFDEGISSLPL